MGSSWITSPFLWGLKGSRNRRVPLPRAPEWVTGEKQQVHADFSFKIKHGGSLAARWARIEAWLLPFPTWDLGNSFNSRCFRLLAYIEVTPEGLLSRFSHPAV